MACKPNQQCIAHEVLSPAGLFILYARRPKFADDCFSKRMIHAPYRQGKLEDEKDPKTLYNKREENGRVMRMREGKMR